jgi:hypothetical protein
MVKIRIHLENVMEPSSRLVWWAESDDVPGFSALADDLNELLVRCDISVADILSEAGRPPAELEYELVSDLPEASAPVSFVPTGPITVTLAGNSQTIVPLPSNPGQPFAATTRTLKVAV